MHTDFAIAVPSMSLAPLAVSISIAPAAWASFAASCLAPGGAAAAGTRGDLEVEKVLTPVVVVLK
jgi:hypothetical protein